MLRNCPTLAGPRLGVIATLLAASCLCALAPAPAASAAVATQVGLPGPLPAPTVADPPDIPRTIVRIARVEFDKGVREVPRGSNNSREIARYRGALVPRAQPAAWCAFFASWVTKAAGAPLGHHGAGIASAAGIRSWAQSTGRWTHAARPGDVAVYNHHVGIVASVEGSRMTTIEGNWSDRVSQLSRSRGEALGFARVAVGDHLTGR
jgi:hypothetical protein